MNYYKYLPYQYIEHGMYLETFDEDIFDYLPPELVHRYASEMNPSQYSDNVIDKKKFSELLGKKNCLLYRTSPA